MSTNIQYLPIHELQPAPNNPFHVVMNSEMGDLIESIDANGVIEPLIVRLSENNDYEIVSGHRRKFACEYLGLQTVPVIVRELDRNEAIIALVDSNLHRENILPSEKAFGYKLKMSALSAQGKRTDLTSCQVGTKFRSDEFMAMNAEDSARQIQRYIRLTNLIPEILDMVDKKLMAFTPAVEISYLTELEQRDLYYEMEAQAATPNLSQAQQLRNLSRQGLLGEYEIARIVGAEKPNQRERLRIPMERIRKYFPQSYTTAQIEDSIIKLCEAQFRRRTERER